MILQDLRDLYKLKRASDPKAIPERFWCHKKVAWEVVLSEDGRPLSCVSLAQEKSPTRTLEVPDVQRTSGVRPFFLCDNAEYFFGLDARRGVAKWRESVSFHDSVLGTLDDPASHAFLMFLHGVQVGEVPAPLDAVRMDSKALMVFRLMGSHEVWMHERPGIRRAWEAWNRAQEAENVVGTCLVTGEQAPRAKLFPQVTGLPGAQSSGASLVSCNAEAFSSYGQPVSTAGAISQQAADEAGAALVYVLKDTGHRLQMGNDYIGFWTDATDPQVDASLAFLLDPDGQGMENPLFGGFSEDKETREAVQTALVELRQGKHPVAIPDNVQYHLLGIAPYQARLAVRFYETGALGQLQQNVVQFLKDTEMVGVRPCSLRAYLTQTAVRGDAKNIPQTLITSCMRAMLRCRPFPEALRLQLLERQRVDHGLQKPWDMGRRAAILKACLVRSWRSRGLSEKEGSLTVALNEDNTNQGYLLGRLFALLEKAQLDAIGNANATIRDRYMGAASITPARVFPQLLKLAQHHISKSEYGGYTDRKIQEVVTLLGNTSFPKTLSYDDQGLFYIGYYQQKQELYTSKKTDDGTDVDDKED